ncbi:hypothetical protein EJV47_11055 [Hymenobacter gummosus]|uniref:Uncharacterized protein n=1 Tax=Hymenobacter gummosus TaxID=1776032 RepID=A0A431U3Q7_9BACT|nr:hypothetical protein [Hymenobacter gummosus]RTQ50166.1 hypothetical protein EJV47_11055 [Hymenobacter gummosus]
MTAAFQTPQRRLGLLFVFASLLPMMVALHQLFVLLGNVLLDTVTPTRSLVLTAELLAAAGLTALLLRQGIRRM